MARAGTAVTHCPCSNQTLASGHCPVHGMEQAGMNVGLGVDGSASNDGSNLMQEVRAAFLLQRLHYGVTAISHRDALRWATAGSAACLGRPDLGVIAPGKQADLALFALDELRFAGHATRWPPWCCAARTGPISSWSAGPGGFRTGRDPRPRPAPADPQPPGFGGTDDNAP